MEKGQGCRGVGLISAGSGALAADAGRSFKDAENAFPPMEKPDVLLLVSSDCRLG